MTLIDILKNIGVNIVENNGILTVNSQTYKNKCFLLALADGIIGMNPNKYQPDELLHQIITLVEKTGVQQDEMIDTEKHIYLINKLEKLFDIQIHVRSSFNGAPAYINDTKTFNDRNVVNILCLTNKSGDVLNGHFVCAKFYSSLDGFI